jgi:ABC-type uncharacterized transport system permease subunit
MRQGETIRERLLPLIIQLVSGAVGGNIAGAALKNLSLGTVLNSIFGILGGGIGGAALLAVVGAIKKAMGK